MALSPLVSELIDYTRSPVLVSTLSLIIEMGAERADNAASTPQMETRMIRDMDHVLSCPPHPVRPDGTSPGALVRQTMRLAREDDESAEVVSLPACLAEIRALVATTWPSGIHFDLHAPPDLPVVACSRASLLSALMNLLFNAREAMPFGGAISVIAARVKDGEVVTGAEVRVADNGIGMSKETILRALEPFFTTKAGGLGGLGLPMVDRFCRDAGGRLSIESQPGAGTTVTLLLPLPPATSMQVDCAAAISDAPASSAHCPSTDAAANAV